MEIRELACCAVKEISLLSSYPSPVSALQNLQPSIRNEPSPNYPEGRFSCRYIIFSQAFRDRHKVGSTDYGENLRDYILQEGLGEVVETGWNKNPNTKREVRVYVWTLNFDALTTWWAANPPVPQRDPRGEAPQLRYASVAEAARRGIVLSEVPVDPTPEREMPF